MLDGALFPVRLLLVLVEDLIFERLACARLCDPRLCGLKLCYVLRLQYSQYSCIIYATANPLGAARRAQRPARVSSIEIDDV